MHPHETGREPAEPRWHRRKEARPAEILEAAMHEFTERGYAATRLEDIARRAGCTKGTIFLYFDTKEDLLEAVVRDTVLPQVQDVEAIVAAHSGTYRDLLLQVMHARWNALVNSRQSGLPKLMLAEAANFPELARFHFEEVVLRLHALVVRVLRAGIASGEFRDHDPELVARVAMAPILTASLWKHSQGWHSGKWYGGPGAKTDEYLETSLDLLLRGLARAADGGTPE